MVDVVRARALQLSDPLGDEHVRRHADHNVDMIVGSADGVDEHSSALYGPFREKPVQRRVDFWSYGRLVEFRMPDEMKVDLGSNVFRHGRILPKPRAGEKPAAGWTSGKPVETG